MTVPAANMISNDPGIILPVRLLAQAGDVLQKLRINPVKLSEESIAAAACKSTGLSDFGTPDFRDATQFVLKTVKAEGELSIVGQLIYNFEIFRLYENRLRLVEMFKRFPEIADEPISRPLFIVSFPRTGTTLLHKLLTQDANVQFPVLWQLLRPTPATASPKEIQSRIKLAEEFVDISYRCIPKWKTLHKMDAHGAEECLFMITNSYGTYGSSESPTYKRWFLERDSVPDYAYYRQQVQMLQWRRSQRRWVFKFPGHLWKLDALLKVFPDAAIVQTHRHPKEMFASWCSLVSLMRHAMSNKVDVQRTARRWLDMMKIGLERAQEVRKAHPENFFDVSYTSLVSDPIGTVRQLYDQFGYPFTPEVTAAMTNWITENPYQKFGAHHYSLEEYGLDEATINQEFQGYIEAFHLNQD